MNGQPRVMPAGARVLRDLVDGWDRFAAELGLHDDGQAVPMDPESQAGSRPDDYYVCGICDGHGETVAHLNRDGLPETVECYSCQGTGWLPEPLDACETCSDVLPEGRAVKCGTHVLCEDCVTVAGTCSDCLNAIRYRDAS